MVTVNQQDKLVPRPRHWNWYTVQHLCKNKKIIWCRYKWAWNLLCVIIKSRFIPDIALIAYPWKSSTFIKVPLSRLTRGGSLSVWLAFIRCSTSFNHWLTATRDLTLMPQFSAAFRTSWYWLEYFKRTFFRNELVRVAYIYQRKRTTKPLLFDVSDSNI